MSLALTQARNIPKLSSNGCVHQMFEAQAASTPNAVAIVQEDSQVTYRELNLRANQLAHHLQSVGVGPDKLVGILVNCSIDMIVGLLAILKAGGAYVPLDPAYPTKRLAEMIKDAGLSVLLTSQSGLIEQLPQTDASVVCIDSDWPAIARNSRENPGGLAKPENLAYVIYTSGSSGKPKGVLIEHRSLTNYVEAAITEFKLEPDDRVLQFASISFDTSAEEIYPCMASGATLVLRTDSMANSMSIFLERCADWNITVLDLPTAYWHELTASLEDENLSLPPSVRLVIIGGEQALPRRVASWRKRIGSRVRLLNTYGPTEATIVATMSDLSEPTDSKDESADAPVGRPIQNVKTYLLNRHKQPAPSGVTGELYIGGAGLARGYLNRPDLTAEKFIPDRFSNEPGARMYRTGDLGRYLADGNLQLDGRIDNQVKINGYRVELEEIETAMRSIAYVRDAVVLAREGGQGEKRLVAYVVPQKNRDSFPQTGLRDQLRAELRTKLPPYMLPSVVIELDGFPLSPNGKVDRNALPPPNSVQTSDVNYVRPRDPLERQIVEIWEEVLNIHPIGIKDNFFDLGGHSLLSVRMMDRVERAFCRRLPLAVLFEEATVEHLAATLLEQERAGPRSAIVEIQRGGAKRPFFFLHGDFNGGGFYCVNLARGLGVDQPFYAIQPHGLDEGPIPATIEAMADSQLRALRAVQPGGPYLLGGYCNSGTIAFEMARQLQAQGERIDLLVLVCASALNVRFRLFDNLVRGLSRIKRRGPDHSLGRFLAIRERLVRAEGIKNHYRSRIAELSRLGGRAKASFLKERGGKAIANLAVAMISILRNSSEAEASRPPDDRRLLVASAYNRALLGYVEKPYRGRVTLLWPEELGLDDPADPTAGWSEVATEVDIHPVPGGHITCLTSKVGSLASTLKVCLERAQAGDARSTTRAARFHYERIHRSSLARGPEAARAETRRTHV